MTKSNALNVTYQQFAEGIGRTDRMTLDASLAWHKEYVKLDAKKQKEWKYDFVLNYVIGKLDCTSSEAEAVCEKTRVQRTPDEEKAVNAGSKKFADHISRTTARSGKKPKEVAVPKQLVSNIVSEIIDAGLTKAQFDALIAQLRDSVAFQ